MSDENQMPFHVHRGRDVGHQTNSNPAILTANSYAFQVLFGCSSLLGRINNNFGDDTPKMLAPALIIVQVTNGTASLKRWHPHAFRMKCAIAWDHSWVGAKPVNATVNSDDQEPL